MYTKTIGGRQVFSDCHTNKLEYDHEPLHAGQWVSNPSRELILADGWEVYVPPVVPQYEPDKDAVILAVKRMLASSTEGLTDEEALEVAAAFPTWEEKVEEGKEVATGKRLWYDGRLWKVLQPHTPQANWTPDTAVSLYVEVSIEEWPEWKQPLGAQDAYNKDDKVTHGGTRWISEADGNIWEPGVYGWRSA